MMHDLYYERDKKRGKNRTFMWLVEEIGELSQALNRKKDEDDLDDIGFEFADIFAWLCSLANILNLNLEEYSIKKYNFQCPKCKKNPCDCEFI